MSQALSVAVDFDPEMVLKGKEVPKTMRLLQLLAIAAAKQMPDAPAKEQPKDGLTRARDLPPVLDGMLQCVTAAREFVDHRRAEKGNANSALEAKLQEMQRQLEEEVKLRLSEEELTAAVQRDLQAAQAAVGKLGTRTDLDREQQQAQEQEKAELRRQAEALMAGTGGPPSEMNEDAVLKLLSAQIAEVSKALEQDSAEVDEMRQRKNELERGRKEIEASCESLNVELEREKNRLEEQENLLSQTPEAQIAILQASEQQLTVRAETLEEKGRVAVEAVDEKKAIVAQARLEFDDMKAKTDDLDVQVNIVQEERDALRDAMEQLWSSKAIIEEDLESISGGYIGLSDRINEMQDEQRNLEEKIEEMEGEIASLQKPSSPHNGCEVQIP